MAMTPNVVNRLGTFSETKTGPNNTTVFVSVPGDVRPDKEKANENITVLAKASGAITTNLTVGLYGRLTEDATPVLLKADIYSGNISHTAMKAAVIDLNDYPMPFYSIGLVSTADNDGIDVDVVVVY